MLGDRQAGKGEATRPGEARAQAPVAAGAGGDVANDERPDGVDEATDQVGRVGVILPFDGVDGEGVGAQLGLLPDEAGDRLADLPVAEAEAEYTPRVEVGQRHAVGVGRRGIGGDAVGRRRGQEQERAPALVEALTRPPQLPGLVGGRVGGVAADDRQRRWVAADQRVDPVGVLQLAGHLVPADTQLAALARQRYGHFRHVSGQAGERLGASLLAGDGDDGLDEPLPVRGGRRRVDPGYLAILGVDRQRHRPARLARRPEHPCGRGHEDDPEQDDQRGRSEEALHINEYGGLLLAAPVGGTP